MEQGKVDSENKKLIDMMSPQGRIFRILLRRSEGTRVGELARKLGIRMSQLLPILIEMFEGGLVKIIQEGHQIEDDIWIISPDIQIPPVNHRKLLLRIRNLKRNVNHKIHETEIEVKHRLPRS